MKTKHDDIIRRLIDAGMVEEKAKALVESVYKPAQGLTTEEMVDRARVKHWGKDRIPGCTKKGG